jgi:hypothetical protein
MYTPPYTFPTLLLFSNPPFCSAFLCPLKIIELFHFVYLQQLLNNFFFSLKYLLMCWWWSWIVFFIFLSKNLFCFVLFLLFFFKKKESFLPFYFFGYKRKRELESRFSASFYLLLKTLPAVAFLTHLIITVSHYTLLF